MSTLGWGRLVSGGIATVALLGLGIYGLQPGSVRASGVVSAAREYRVESVGDGRMRWRLLDGAVPGGPVTVAEGVLVETRGEPVAITLNSAFATGTQAPKGATLVTIDVPVAVAAVATLAAERDATQAEVEALEAGGRNGDIAAAQAEVSVARASLKETLAQTLKLEDLAKTGAAPSWEVDTAWLKVSVQEAIVAAALANVAAARQAPLPAEIAASQGRLAAAEARLGEATARTDATILAAPFAGTVYRPGGAVLVSLRDEGVGLVQIALPENRRSEVEVGAALRFKPTGGTDNIKGTLLSIAAAAAPSANGSIVWAVARLDEPVPSGATGRVEIDGGGW